ncbi:hypothetical protein C8R44DRAFT_892093 [Mycena epipterygia]|nr:hypothetical protein C8R44DRAFT_892093 [Mycena epipterygia]
MALFVRYGSPFAETEPPPPPVVLLLLQTDLTMHTSTGLVIHEDLELVPSAKKDRGVTIPVPQMLTRKVLEHHETWEGDKTETALIKKVVHELVETLLDTTSAISDQEAGLLEEVFRRAAQMFPILRKYDDNWATRCIVQARLKATSANASNKAVKKAVANVANIVSVWTWTAHACQVYAAAPNPLKRLSLLLLDHCLTLIGASTFISDASSVSFLIVRIHSSAKYNKQPAHRNSSGTLFLLFETIAMDVDSDPETPNDNGDARHAKTDTVKVRLVTGPQHEDYETARDMEAFHKDQTLLAKQKNRRLALENQQLLADLAAAEKLKAQHHEGQLEAQFIVDQEKLQTLWNQCNTMFPQLMEAQKLLLERNEDVERLNRLWSVEKKDEAIQLRAQSHLQGKKTAQNKPPPRRGARASLDPVRNSSTRTIQIPLNPHSIATPAFANLLGTDIETFDDVTVNVEETTPRKRNEKKYKKPGKVLLNHIHGVLRRTTYDKFNVEQAADFEIYNPAEEAKVAACENEFTDPADDLFQWDFAPGYAQSRWNDLMIVKVVDAALKADGEDGDIAKGGVERDYLEALMVDKLARYRTAWKGFQPRFNESLGRMETAREARARGVQTSEQHQLSCRSTSAKSRKFEDRVNTTTATIEIKRAEGIATDIETWERLLEMLEHLGPQGMSSEEEDEVEVDDAKVFIYRVKLCIWREPLVVDTNEVPPPLRESEMAPAGVPKLRVAFPGASTNRDWLKKKTPAYLKELKVSKEAFGLFVAATERMAL